MTLIRELYICCGTYLLSRITWIKFSWPKNKYLIGNTIFKGTRIKIDTSLVRWKIYHIIGMESSGGVQISSTTSGKSLALIKPGVRWISITKFWANIDHMAKQMDGKLIAIACHSSFFSIRVTPLTVAKPILRQRFLGFPELILSQSEYSNSSAPVKVH